MSDGNRQRPAIDLDDLERQLRAVAQPKAAARPMPSEPARSLESEPAPEPPQAAEPKLPPFLTPSAPFAVKPVFAARPAEPLLPENESFSVSESEPMPAAPLPPKPFNSPTPPLPPLPSSRSSDYDPLAELARIAQSGTDWGQPRAADAPSSSSPRSSSAVDALEALLRMDPPVKAPPPSFAPVSRRVEPQPIAPEPAFEKTDQPSLDFSTTPEPVAGYEAQPTQAAYQEAVAEAEPIYAPEGQLPPHDAHFVDEEPPPRSRTGAKLAFALVSIAALAGGGVYLWSGGHGLPGADGPRTTPLIKASNEPTKVAPQNPGGMEVPNTNKEIFSSAKNSTASSGPSKVVTSEEQPVDVAQAARPAQPRVILPNGGSAATVPPAPPPPVSTLPRQTGSAAPANNAAPTANATAEANASAMAALGEPKRVRTVSVRPDGTVIDGTEPVRPPSMAAPATVSPTSPVPTQTLPAAAAAPPATGAPLPALVPSTPAPSDPVASAQPAPAGTPLPPRRPSAAQMAAAPAAVPETAPTNLRPAAAPPSVAVPSAAVPSAAAPAPANAAPSAAPVASVGSGDFAVQLAAPPTEQEARTLAARLVQRYGEALAGQEPDIIRAEVNGKTLYRVRVTGLDRESANAMCNRVKGLQGSCFVAKN